MDAVPMAEFSHGKINEPMNGIDRIQTNSSLCFQLHAFISIGGEHGEFAAAAPVAI